MAKAGIGQSNPLAALGSILRGRGGRNSGRGGKKSSLTDSPILKQKSTESPRFFRRTSEPPPTATPPKSPKGFRFGLRRSSSRSKKGNHLEPGSAADDIKSETVSVSSLNVQTTVKEEESMETEPSPLKKDTSATAALSEPSSASNSVSPFKSESPVSPPPPPSSSTEGGAPPAAKKPARDSILFKDPPEVESLFSDDSNLFGSCELDALFGKEKARVAREKTPERILDAAKRKRERIPEIALDKPKAKEESHSKVVVGGRKTPERALEETKNEKPVVPKPAQKPAKEDGGLKARMQLYEARYKASRDKEEQPVATSTPSKDVLSSSPKRAPFTSRSTDKPTETETSPKRMPYTAIRSCKDTPATESESSTAPKRIENNSLPKRTYGKTPPVPAPKPFSPRSTKQERPTPMDTKEKSKSPEPTETTDKDTSRKPKAVTGSSPQHEKEGGGDDGLLKKRTISDILGEAVMGIEADKTEEAAKVSEKKTSLFEDEGEDENVILFTPAAAATTKTTSPPPPTQSEDTTAVLKPKSDAEKKKASLFEDELFQDDFKPKEQITSQKVDIFGSKKEFSSPTRKPSGGAKEDNPIKDFAKATTPPPESRSEPVRTSGDSDTGLFGREKESSPSRFLMKDDDDVSSTKKDIFGRSKRTVASPERETTSPRETAMEVESHDFSVERRTNLFGEPLDDFKKSKVNGIEDTDSMLFVRRPKHSPKLEDSDDELESDIFVDSKAKTSDLSRKAEPDDEVTIEAASEDPLGAIKTGVEKESEERERMKRKPSKDSALESDMITSGIEEPTEEASKAEETLPSPEITISPTPETEEEEEEKATPSVKDDSEDITASKSLEEDASKKTEEVKDEEAIKTPKKPTHSRAETSRPGTTGSGSSNSSTARSRLDTKDSPGSRTRSRTALDTGRTGDRKSTRGSPRDDKKDAAGKPSWMLELQHKKKDDKPSAAAATAAATKTSTTSATSRRRDREIPAWQREILDRKKKPTDSGKSSATASAKSSTASSTAASTRGTRSPRLGRTSPSAKSPSTGRKTPTSTTGSKSPTHTRSSLAGRRSPRNRQREELDKSLDGSSLDTITKKEKAGRDKKDDKFTASSKKVDPASKPRLLTKKPSIEISVRSSTSKSESSDPGKPETEDKPTSPVENKQSSNSDQKDPKSDDTKVRKSQSDEAEEDEVFRSKSATPSDELVEKKAMEAEKKEDSRVTSPVEKTTSGGSQGSRQSSISSDRDGGELQPPSRSSTRSGSSTPTKAGSKLVVETTGVPVWKKQLLERKKSGSGPPPARRSPRRDVPAAKEAEPPSWKKELLAKKKTKPTDEKVCTCTYTYMYTIQ